MNKVLAELVKVKFPEVPTALFMEVIEATPNPELATEILCGLYEQPSIQQGPVYSKDRTKRFRFGSYNKWKNQVSVFFMENVSKSSYFPKGTTESDVTMETFDSMKVSSNTPDCVYLYIPTGTQREATTTFELETWNSFDPA